MNANEIDYNNFPWEEYIKINCLHNFQNKDDAWEHWINHGNKEGRPISILNNSRVHQARFGNLFFINMAVHLICLKSKLKFDYKYYELFKKLGIDLYIGYNTFKENLILSDNDFLNYIINSKSCDKNITINNEIWCQTSEFCLLLKEYFHLNKVKRKIINKNLYKNRYNNNNDLFIHVRLGDIANSINNSFEYYDNILKKISFNNGFIASDTIDSSICQKLIKKYNLHKIILNEVETIMFGSTCKYIVLSGGTFSWLIGFLAYYSKSIIYPKGKKNKWYGDIFIFDEWIGIEE
jgi:hypothetical protein